MSKKSVFVEKSPLTSETFLNVEGYAKSLVGIHHYAVKVDDRWYEVANDTGAFSGIMGMKNGHTRTARGGAVLSLAGATFKTFNEIREYCDKWLEDHPDYKLLETNCQTFALDLAQWLVPSFKFEQPLAQTNAWADGPGSHSISAEG